MLIGKFGFLAAVVSLPLFANAQWAPIHASETKTTTVIDATGKSHVAVTQGTFDRSSSGYELEKLSNTGGSMWEIHLTNAHGHFRLTPANKHAYLISTQPPLSIAPQITDTHAIGHEEIEGVQCAIFQVRSQDASGRPIVIGKTWEDLSRSLLIKEDFTLPGGSNSSTHIVMTRSEITNTEPDQLLFEVPTEFTVVQPPGPQQH